MLYQIKNPSFDSNQCSSYPAQELVGGDSKIPTIIYYDQEGKVRAVGAEAVRAGIEEEAEDGQWTKSEWRAVTTTCFPSMGLIAN
jgi:hypothetical protein